LQKQPEPIQVSDTYLLLFCTWGDGERSYERIGTITETEIQTTYATPEMLDRYGNAYTAAAADIGGAYRSQKYRTWLNTQQEK
ncbi:MAG: hypothetical protein IJX64_03490, partial [Clostridia bacterium]|nr:hypothetical protein [Clostridia bacterium]